jgi:cell shape-determining protein MreC
MPASTAQACAQPDVAGADGAYWITDLPQRLWQGVASQFGSRTELVAENEKLKTENLLLQGRMQKLAALTEQNVRLRELLNSSALVNEKVEVAELIGMDPNPSPIASSSTRVSATAWSSASRCSMPAA